MDTTPTCYTLSPSLGILSNSHVATSGMTRNSGHLQSCRREKNIRVPFYS